MKYVFVTLLLGVWSTLKTSVQPKKLVWGEWKRVTKKTDSTFLKSRILDTKKDCFPCFSPYDAFQTYSITVLNRWGQQAFSSNNPDEVWICNSDKIPDSLKGTWFYFVKYSFTSQPDSIYSMAGRVDIVVEY